VYTGSLSKYHRITPLCEALRISAARNPDWRISLTVVGKVDPLVASELRSLDGHLKVKITGYLSRHRVIEEQRNAWRLLAYGMTGGLQIPSKLVEYAAAGTPVLLLSEPGSNDLAAEWVAEKRAGVVVQNGTEAIVEYLERQSKSESLSNTFGSHRDTIPTWAQMEASFLRLLQSIETPSQQAK
jgi:glycosyltransferase involved in cell wall biosynthesis